MVTASQRLEKERTEKAESIIDLFRDALWKVRINSDFSKVVDCILNCKGKIITTGMGKAGIAMKKFSSLLCSVSFPSCYLHPGESSHGDLGLLSENDILFVASTSGKTREVLEIIELARNIKISQIIGITSHKDSPIREKADYIIDMGVIEEASSLPSGSSPFLSLVLLP